MKRTLRTLSLLFSFTLFGCSFGCSTASYLGQAAMGQLSLWNHARPIEEVMQDETVSPRVKLLLQRVPSMKTFGERFGIKPTKNYIEYVKLDRPYVVTIVSASEELKFESKTWSFPIVGGFTYLGFFKPERAKAYADEIAKEERKEGKWDVDVRGAPAYSTLGWFRDAILSSMIPDGESAAGDLAEVVIHESVHATFFVENQSPFNEGLAQFIAERLAPIYLKENFGENSVEYKAYHDEQSFSKEYSAAFRAAYLKLDALYQSKVSDDEKRENKKIILENLRKKFGIKKEINNATLVQFKTYSGSEAVFEQAFQKCGSDWRRFLASLSRIRESFRLPHQSDLDSIFKDWKCEASS